MEPSGRGTPRILLPGRLLPAGRAGRQAVVAMGQRYLDAVIHSGGVEMVCQPRPEMTEAEADALLAHAQGLILPGGGDVEPGRYGQAAHARTYGVNPNQDHFEVSLLAAALRRQLPVLAICRGLQLVNVAFGGTLIQHLDDRTGACGHTPPSFPDAEPGSIGPLLAVDLVPDSRLVRLLGGTEPAGQGPGTGSGEPAVQVVGAHSHHQAVDQLGRGLRVVGRSSDGVVEAMEHPGHWLVAVQWHPEDTFATDETMQHLFRNFIEEARRH